MNSSSSFHFHLFIFGFVVVFLQCLYPTGAATCHPDDEAGLLGFKSSVIQDPSGILSSWEKGTDCCSSWSNILCDEGGRVNSLFIDLYPDEGKTLILSGTFSPLLAKLQHLERVSLSNFRNVTGSFPQFFFQLPNLYFINIGNNGLSGPLPANIDMLSKLTALWASGNRFTGPIPSSLSKIPGLSAIDLGGNLLTGTIPLEFANLKKVFYLSLSDNHLSGTIPNIFKSMNSVQSLYLSGNKFSGELPPSFASLSQVLFYFTVGHNNLSGTFPSYLSRFDSLETLDLSWNRFSGVVPKSFSNLTRIVNMDLSHNLLTDPFPVMNVKDMQTLDLSYSQFHFKRIPKWVSSAPIITSLKLAKCGIKMNLNDWKPKREPNPRSLAGNIFFDSIDFSENEISGSPAKFLNEKYQVQEFRASGNKLRFDLGKVNFSSALKTLDLSRNLVYGKVPVMLAGLNTLNLSQNHLCGKLPVTKFPASAFAGNDCLCGSPLAPCKL